MDTPETPDPKRQRPQSVLLGIAIGVPLSLSLWGAILLVARNLSW
jgi:hypothetical protein